MSAPLPIPFYPGVPGVVWGSKPYNGEKSGTLRDLIGWGDTAPAPLQLNAIERIAFAFYGGWIQCEAGDTNSAWAPDGSVIQMDGAYKEGNFGRWSNAQGDGLWHGIAASWATDPRATLAAAPKAGTFAPTFVKWGALPFPTGADSSQGDGVATATNLYGWGIATIPAQRLTQLDFDAIKGGGWAKVQGPNGTGIINLLDPRYAKNGDGTWQNRNHAGKSGLAGIVTAAASKPHNGVAGYIDSVEHDISANPLGGILLLVVLVPLAELAPALLALGEGDAVAIGVSQAVGSSAVLDANKFVATHPAEVGEVAAGAELAVAGAVVGGKFGAQLGKFGAQALGSGIENSLPGDNGAIDLGGSSGSGTVPVKPWWKYLTGG